MPAHGPLKYAAILFAEIVLNTPWICALFIRIRVAAIPQVPLTLLKNPILGVIRLPAEQPGSGPRTGPRPGPVNLNINIIINKFKT